MTRAIGLAMLCLCAPLALAQTPRDRADIDAGTATHATGRIAVNQAAGTGNAQANLAAIAVGDASAAHVDAMQGAQVGDQRGVHSRAARAHIGVGAFADGSGLLSVNQAAGSGNAQLNLFALGAGASASAGQQVRDVLDDRALSTVTGDTAGRPPGTPPPTREARIDAGAFHGASGVVQINQTAGAGNASVNAIVLQLPGSAL